MNYTLRILHLSDLHERGPRESEGWRRRRVLGQAFSRNLDELLSDGPVDLVCFTGDIADWGLAQEYERASEFVSMVLERLGLPKERLFLIPGNHDINRQQGAEAWLQMRQNLHHLSTQTLSRWMLGTNVPYGFGDEVRQGVLSRQAAYREWIANLGRSDLLPARSPHGHLGYRVTVRLPGWPFDIQMIGLDSAWLAGDDTDAGKLRLTEDQVMRLGTVGGNPLPGFRIALMHHPLTDLGDGTACRRLLAENADLLLRGHLHETEFDLWADPERSLRQIATGCLYEGHNADAFPNACVLVRATLNTLGRPLCYSLRFRGWSNRGFWFDDSSLYRESKNGLLNLEVQSEQQSQQQSITRTPRVTSTQEYSVPEKFDVFIAYNSSDSQQIEFLSDELKRRGINIWIDREQISPGKWFQNVIQEAILNVKSIAIIIGNNGIGKWQSAELRAAISQCINEGIPVIPVLLAGVSNISAQFPFLKELQWVKFKHEKDMAAIDQIEWGVTGKRPIHSH